MSLAEGTRIGPYEIVGLIGAGGMGEVFRARDTRLGRDMGWTDDGEIVMTVNTARGRLWRFTPIGSGR